jgi:hypothetical protein
MNQLLAYAVSDLSEAFRALADQTRHDSETVSVCLHQRHSEPAPLPLDNEPLVGFSLVSIPMKTTVGA